MIVAFSRKAEKKCNLCREMRSISHEHPLINESFFMQDSGINSTKGKNMRERILVIGDKNQDLDLINTLLGSKGFDIDIKSLSEDIEDTLIKDEFSAILADYDLTGDKVIYWISLLQKNRCKSFFILYGENIETVKISEILQAGAYGFIPRSMLPERIYNIVSDGMENRKAFIEILGLLNDLKKINGGLTEETKAEKKDFDGVLSQNGFMDCLVKEFKRAIRYNRPLSLIIIKVDNLKAIAESFDHQAGYFVLKRLSECLKNTVRLVDIVSRHGDDGFSILLPETEMMKAKMLVKRLISTIKNYALERNSERINLEISYGMSTTRELKKNETEKELILKAGYGLQNTTHSPDVTKEFINYPTLNKFSEAVLRPICDDSRRSEG